MSTNYHTAFSGNVALTNANLNSPLGTLDAQITTNTNAISGITTIDLNSIAVGGRLSGSSSLPVTTANTTSITTLYYHPYVSGYIPTYDGASTWQLSTITAGGISLSVPSTTNTNYDVFVYDSSGTAALELTAWTDATNRATALTYQDGVLVKSGTSTRRYVGSIRTGGTTGQTEDSNSKRFIWNYYHRKVKQLSVVESTDNWTYATANTWRSANSSSSNRVEMLIGVNEDIVTATVHGFAFGGASTWHAVGIGEDSTSANSATVFGSWATTSAGTPLTAEYKDYIGIGYHYLQWLESQNTASSTTWAGDYGVSEVQAGLVAEVWC